MSLVYVGLAKNTKNVVAPYKKNIMYPTISIVAKTTPILIDCTDRNRSVCQLAHQSIPRWYGQ